MKYGAYLNEEIIKAVLHTKYMYVTRQDIYLGPIYESFGASFYQVI